MPQEWVRVLEAQMNSNKVSECVLERECVYVGKSVCVFVSE